MLLWILGGLLALVVIVVAIAATRPSEFVIERSATLAAPPAQVYAHLHDFRRWQGWSPWAHLDPNMKVEYGGEPTGVGATYYWLGNSKAGEGRMVIEHAEPPRQLELRLEFLKPFRATNSTTFTLVPQGEGTRVSWAMRGTRSLMMKVMGLLLNLDKLVGRDFERGLAALDTVTAADTRSS
ncbi:MAG: SRPBCC family protein [Kofleriaceae bacterium]